MIILVCGRKFSISIFRLQNANLKLQNGNWQLNQNIRLKFLRGQRLKYFDKHIFHVIVLLHQFFLCGAAVQHQHVALFLCMFCFFVYAQRNWAKLLYDAARLHLRAPMDLLRYSAPFFGAAEITNFTRWFIK